MNTNIANLISEIQAATGWSQTRIASELNVKQATVSRLLGGQQSCSLHTFLSIFTLHDQTINQKKGECHAEHVTEIKAKIAKAQGGVH